MKGRVGIVVLCSPADSSAFESSPGFGTCSRHGIPPLQGRRREGGREEGGEGGRKGRRERGREEGKEGEREGGREGGREEGR